MSQDRKMMMKEGWSIMDKQKILIADDSEMNRSLLANYSGRSV